MKKLFIINFWKSSNAFLFHADSISTSSANPSPINDPALYPIEYESSTVKI